MAFLTWIAGKVAIFGILTTLSGTSDEYGQVIAPKGAIPISYFSLLWILYELNNLLLRSSFRAIKDYTYIWVLRLNIQRHSFVNIFYTWPHTDSSKLKKHNIYSGNKNSANSWQRCQIKKPNEKRVHWAGQNNCSDSAPIAPEGTDGLNSINEWMTRSKSSRSIKL